MKSTNDTGVFQLKNGNWAFRYVVMVNGVRKEARKTKDETGNPYRTKKEAIKARKTAIAACKKSLNQENETPKKVIKPHITFSDVYQEYCEHGRNEKAYTTMLKQDSLWNNHISEKFGNRFIDEVSVAEINDYLSELYYVDGFAYRYVESFLKIFYLIFGQAYSRNYLNVDIYNKLCVNKNTKIHMPKIKNDEDTDVIIFTQEQLSQLDNYFTGTNAETAYLLGRYCGLRISECYSLKWSDIDIEQGTITLSSQMQYQKGLIKLVPLKTRSAKRTIYMNDRLKSYFSQLEQQNISAADELAAQRAQNQTTIIDYDGTAISSLVLVNSLPNGKIQTLNSMKYHARKIKEQLGFNFKYHYLRHTYGTLLADMNTPAHILCNQMGHASSKVTERYYLSVSKTGIDILTQNLNAI